MKSKVNLRPFWHRSVSCFMDSCLGAVLAGAISLSISSHVGCIIQNASCYFLCFIIKCFSSVTSVFHCCFAAFNPAELHLPANKSALFDRSYVLCASSSLLGQLNSTRQLSLVDTD
ncbi:Protein NRT1/ PTR FAMILY 6.3 [Trichinella spiralis]|uniref:Protein NRT1/ PTR FAMILY 6.3 n=1 Tax=Trichinella spiralis TaxID=6334 RepID=A0ABR3KE63_TRISP